MSLAQITEQLPEDKGVGTNRVSVHLNLDAIHTAFDIYRLETPKPEGKNKINHYARIVNTIKKSDEIYGLCGVYRQPVYFVALERGSVRAKVYLEKLEVEYGIKVVSLSMSDVTNINRATMTNLMARSFVSKQTKVPAITGEVLFHKINDRQMKDLSSIVLKGLFIEQDGQLLLQLSYAHYRLPTQDEVSAFNKGEAFCRGYVKEGPFLIEADFDANHYVVKGQGEKKTSVPAMNLDYNNLVFARTDGFSYFIEWLNGSQYFSRVSLEKREFDGYSQKKLARAVSVDLDASMIASKVSPSCVSVDVLEAMGEDMLQHRLLVLNKSIHSNEDMQSQISSQLVDFWLTSKKKYSTSVMKHISPSVNVVSTLSELVLLQQSYPSASVLCVSYPYFAYKKRTIPDIGRMDPYDEFKQKFPYGQGLNLIASLNKEEEENIQAGYILEENAKKAFEQKKYPLMVSVMEAWKKSLFTGRDIPPFFTRLNGYVLHLCRFTQDKSTYLAAIVTNEQCIEHHFALYVGNKTNPKQIIANVLDALGTKGIELPARVRLKFSHQINQLLSNLTFTHYLCMDLQSGEYGRVSETNEVMLPSEQVMKDFVDSLDVHKIKQLDLSEIMDVFPCGGTHWILLDALRKRASTMTIEDFFRVGNTEVRKKVHHSDLGAYSPANFAQMSLYLHINYNINLMPNCVYHSVPVEVKNGFDKASINDSTLWVTLETLKASPMMKDKAFSSYITKLVEDHYKAQWSTKFYQQRLKEIEAPTKVILPRSVEEYLDDLGHSAIDTCQSTKVHVLNHVLLAMSPSSLKPSLRRQIRLWLEELGIAVKDEILDAVFAFSYRSNFGGLKAESAQLNVLKHIFIDGDDYSISRNFDPESQVHAFSRVRKLMYSNSAMRDHLLAQIGSPLVQYQQVNPNPVMVKLLREVALHARQVFFRECKEAKKQGVTEPAF